VSSYYTYKLGAFCLLHCFFVESALSVMPNTAQRIRAKLDQLPPGQPVGYADFVREPSEFGAVAAALSRLSKSGELTRLAKG
jgi:hypothetical protein